MQQDIVQVRILLLLCVVLLYFFRAAAILYFFKYCALLFCGCGVPRVHPIPSTTSRLRPGGTPDVILLHSVVMTSLLSPPL